MPPTPMASDVCTPLLSVRRLKTVFPLDEGTVIAVKDVSFDLHAGRTLALVGESGCGKSVTARSILRLLDRPGRIEAGQVLLRRPSTEQAGPETIDLAKLDDDGPRIREVRGGEIGLIFQEPMASLSPVHTIGNQLTEAIRLHRDVSKCEARSMAIGLLREVGIPQPQQRIDFYGFELSGGLRQRAMIAIALACRPRLLIADEPTTALDVTTQAQILQLLRQLQAQHEMAILLITHDLGVVAQTADDVAVMYLGEIVECADVDTIFHDPRHPYTRALLKSMPAMHATNRGRLETIAGSVPHPFQRPSGCPFHPRCPQVITGQCDCQAPRLRAIGESHQVSCLLEEAGS